MKVELSACRIYKQQCNCALLRACMHNQTFDQRSTYNNNTCWYSKMTITQHDIYDNLGTCNLTKFCQNCIWWLFDQVCITTISWKCLKLCFGEFFL